MRPGFLCLTSLFFLLIQFSVHQISCSQGFTGKIILGVNGAQLDGDGVGGFYRAGLLAGVGATFQVNEKLSIGPEFLFSGKGSQVTLDQVTKGIYPSPRKMKLNYIDFPIIGTYRIREGFRILAGVSINYLLTAEIDAGTNVDTQDAKYLFSDIDYQILAGIEYEIFDNVWLQGRWSYSLVAINKDGPTNPAYQVYGNQQGGFFNNLLQFSLRFDLSLGGTKKPD